MPEKQEEREREPFDPASGDTAEQPVVENGESGRREKRKARKEQKRAEKEQAKADKEQEKEAREQGAKDEQEPKKPAKQAKKKAKKQEPEPQAAPPAGDYRRVGHKGADSIVEGNTIESFEAAVDAGVDMVEFDVLRTRDGTLIVAHDRADASQRRPLTLIEALDAFCEPPLDQVEIDCDLKLPGREAELAGAIAGHGLLDRTMISTMEVESLVKLRGIDPDLRLGWTFPKTRRDWTQEKWARPAMGAGLYVLRRRFPGMIRERAPQLGVEAVWGYHLLITDDAIEAAEETGIELIAWTVDEAERVDELAALGVHGIVSNDPRLLS